MAVSFVKVALDVPLRRSFDYAVGSFLPCVGARVVVPFAHRQLSGVVIELGLEGDECHSELKTIHACPGDMPPLSVDTLAMCRFVADYYQYPFGQVLAAALPVVFRSADVFTPPAPRLLYQAIDPESLMSGLPIRAKAQRRVAEALSVAQSPKTLRQLAPPAMRWIAEWLQAGFLKTLLDPGLPVLPAQTPPVLNDEQIRVTQQILQQKGFAAFLLFGITGSGKTEIYLQTIAEQIKNQKQVLVLVPEINLTPQLVSRFYARFPQSKIANLHSGLNETERAVAWLAAQAGEADIVLGTRLSVFTPLPRLGLIVVDEEHDTSYKQQDGLRYSARDVAVYRASQANVPVVLGSATPSLESWRNAESGRYQLLELTKRAVHGAVLPSMRLLSMRRAPQREGLHEAAITAISAALARQEQALIFINRRGYSPVLACDECGWMAVCKHCSARLVLHLSERRLRCHHCGFDVQVARACPDCGNQDIKPLGRGTQRIEQSVQSLFPQHQVLRIDRDSTRKKGSLEAVLNTVNAGEADILIGTQMLAKGHDFQQLNCVVVLEADTGLFSVDFRAEERMFALLTQVAGRAGRREQAGEVLIQTQFPEHPFYTRLLAGNYRAFAQQALQERGDLAMPPYAAWALFRAEAKQLSDALAFLQQVKQCFAEREGCLVYDPVAATMLKKAGQERAQLLVSAMQRQLLISLLRAAMPQIALIKSRNVRWSLDVDPMDV